MRIRLAFPPKSMWLPVGIIVLVLAVGYAYAMNTQTGSLWIGKAKQTIGLPA